MAKRLKSNTILIIEDDADIRTFARRVLELEGYNVFQAETGEKGLRLARKRDVRLVLLDLRLPGDSGWLVLEQMRGEPEISTIPVIVFTASVGVPQHDRAIAMGASDYLIKPLSATALKNAVDRILQRKR